MSSNSNCRQAVLSLETIAVELQIAIFEFLCPHCCSGLTIDSSDNHSGVETLKALSLTSKKIRPMALSVLLHQANRNMLIKPLTRLIDTYPELGNHTQRLTSPLFAEPSDEELEYYKQAATRLLRRIGDVQPLEHDRTAALCPESFGAELLIALTPAVRSLRLQITDHPASFPRANKLPFLSRVLGSPNDRIKFKNVQFLILESQLGVEGVGLGFYSTLAVLTSFASSLQYLKCVELQSGPPWPRTIEYLPELPQLESLEFENCTFARSTFGGCTRVLRQIVKRSPKLQRVKFSLTKWVRHNRHFDHVNSTEFLEALLPRYLTLKHISFDIEDFLAGQYMLQSRFVNLETVELAASTFCYHLGIRGLRVQDRGVYGPVCLSSILPPKIQHLQIKMDNPWATWNDVREIGRERVEKNAFPCLGRIHITIPSGWHIDPKYDGPEWLHAVQDMRESFAGTDLSLKIEENYLQ